MNAVHLKLSKCGYESAVELAAQRLDDPPVRAAVARVADALGQEGVLTDLMVRKALGPQLLTYLARAATEQHGELAA